jgi:hypothetical protein
MSSIRTPPVASSIDLLPDPQAIRERLGSLLRETYLLRRLLPLAERAAQERERRENLKEGAE